MSQPVTLRVSAESAHLYAAALASDPVLRATFVIEERPSPFVSRQLTASHELTPQEREHMALDDGRKTLRAIKEHLYETGQLRDQRAYWRDAQRQHRAASK